MLQSRPFDLSDVSSEIRRFRDRRGWQKFHRPKELAAALAIEAAELQELFLWRGDENSSDIRADNLRMNSLADEVADISIYLLLFVMELELDVADAVRKKLARNENRFPPQI